jgi:N-formylglutamate deformylase
LHGGERRGFLTARFYANLHAMSHPAFTLSPARGLAGPLVFASPHSGRDYPPELLAESPLGQRAIRSSEDAYVDELIADAPDLGVPLLTARMPRAYVDLNRASEELDPALIEGLGKVAMNPRVAAGLGVIPRVVAQGQQIYRRRLSRAEAEDRIARIWQPYHAKLGRLMDAAQAAHGMAVLIDWHSMPHEALMGVSRGTDPAPEVVLGDRYGAAAAPWITDRVEAAFTAAGFRVGRNTPFAGVYVSQAYGVPAANRHVVQVELDRALYLHEGQLLRKPGFGQIRARLRAVMAEIATIGWPDVPGMAAQ